MTTIALDAVTRSFGSVDALGPVSITLDDRQATAIVGPSGCGKSTLLRLAAGLIEPSGGDVRANGNAITGPDPDRGVVFQQNALFPWLTVAGNIGFGLREQGVERAEVARRVADWIAAVGLGGFADVLPGTLSGGMAQRVALARALAPEPGALLLDEPFGALDRITRGQMQDVLVEVWQRTAATLLLVTHDVEEALVVCDRVLVMSPRPGRILADIPVDLPRPRTLDSRTSSGFVALRRRIESILHEAMTQEAPTAV